MKAKMMLGVALSALSAAATTVYVSPDGSDSNPGTKARPLATAAAARDAVRKLPDKTGATVEFADGTYRMAGPLELDARDGGVVWRAENRGKAVWSGSVRPTAHGRVTDPAVLALLPEAARGKVVYAELPEGVELPGFRGGGCGTPARLCEIPVSVFQGERRLEVARWPNDGFVRTGENVGRIEQRHDARFSQTGVFKFENERMAAWTREPDLWTYGLWCYEWADAKAQVLKVDPAAGTIAVDPSPIGFGIREHAQFHVMNALSELDRPGEWVIDRKRRRVYVWPIKDGGRLGFSCAPGLVAARNAKDVTFDGLVFDCSRTDALVFTDCSSCAVRASTVRRTSAWAVVVTGGASNRVEGCDLYDLGEGGVWLTGGDFATLTPGGHVADNNHIHHYGNVVPNYKPGVQLNGVGNRATHNLIHHSRHQAVAFGGNDHYIGWNVIHDMCTFNDDAGSIYCCQRDWTRRGTVIERNLIHMTGKQPNPTHTEAIYLDDFSSGVIVRGNIINRASLGVYIGGGQDCVVDGNVILNCGNAIRLGSRGIETFAKDVSGLGRKSGMFKRLDSLKDLLGGALWRTRYPNLLKVYDFEDGVFAHNAFFNVITNNVCAGSGPVEKDNWAKVGPYCTVAGNLEVKGDPGFADYTGFDWELKPGSPAAKLVGRTEFAKMGLYASPARASAAVKFAPDVTPPPEIRQRLAPATVRIDYQMLGDLPAGMDGFLEDMHYCELPNWGRGKRAVACYGIASNDGWVEYACSFTPRFDCKVQLTTMGTRGEDTLYDDFRVTGASLPDGGFETGKGWIVPHPNPKDYRAPICNLEPPYGIINANQAGVPAAEGRWMGCGNDMLNFIHELTLRKGVPVTIRFKARAAIPSDKRVSKWLDWSRVNDTPADPRLPFADPFVLYADGRYYAYGTYAADGIAVAESTDLKTWKTGVGRGKGGLALHKDDTFGNKCFWAPEVHRRRDGKYVLFYSAELHTCTAVAESPLGPFVQPTQKPLYPDKMTIDNTLVLDDDGTPWMFHVQSHGHGNEIWRVRMSDDLLSVLPETERFVLRAEKPWESVTKWTAEGPSVVKVNGRWWLLYSCNDCRSQDYAVGFAVADRLTGAWRKPDGGNPILNRTEGMSGVGHGAPFRDAEGKWRYVFHAHNSGDCFGPRRTYITDLAFGEAVTAAQSGVTSCVKAK